MRGKLPPDPEQPPACACGEKNAPFGIGPPKEEVQRWLCRACWSGLADSQAGLAERLHAALDDDDD